MVVFVLMFVYLFVLKVESGSGPSGSQGINHKQIGLLRKCWGSVVLSNLFQLFCRMFGRYVGLKKLNVTYMKVASLQINAMA